MFADKPERNGHLPAPGKNCMTHRQVVQNYLDTSAPWKQNQFLFFFVRGAANDVSVTAGVPVYQWTHCIITEQAVKLIHKNGLLLAKMRDTNEGGRVLDTSAHLVSCPHEPVSSNHLICARSGTSVVRVTCEYRVCGTLCACRVCVKQIVGIKH
jgi:hypothetical protein